ncbi:MAG: hypothetical protein D6805_08900 [Planctomycetota bacterium]|nr:MAG: hypothetical protein D6805_08900 [Planctomycetota bacterium]
MRFFRYMSGIGLLLWISCSSSSSKVERVARSSVQPGKWSKLVLRSSLEQRFYFISQFYQSRGMELPPGLKLERSEDFRYDSYANVLYIMPDGRLVEAVFKRYAPKSFRSYFPGLSSQKLRDISVLFETVLLHEKFLEILFLHHKVFPSSLSLWKQRLFILRLSIGFLRKISEDPYIAWLGERLREALGKAQRDIGTFSVPAKGKTAQEFWLDANFPLLWKEAPLKAFQLIFAARNRYWNTSISWKAEVEALKALLAKQREQISFRYPRYEVRTLFTKGRSSLVETLQGRRYQGIRWLEVDGENGVYFSDGRNIYRVEKDLKAQVVLQGAKGFFRPNIFRIDLFFHLYLVEPTHIRVVNLRKKRVYSYSLGLLLPHLGEGSFYGNYPFAVDPIKRYVYLVDNGRKKIFQVQLPSRPSGAIRILGRYSFSGRISSILAYGGKLWVANYDFHTIQRLDPLTQEWETYAGVEGVWGHRDGERGKALFYRPIALALDVARRSLLVAEEGNHSVRELDLEGEGVVRTVVGLRRGESDGGVRRAGLNLPIAVAADRKGNIYVAEQANASVRVVASRGWGYTFRGSLRFQDVYLHLGAAKEQVVRRNFHQAYRLLQKARLVSPIGYSLYRVYFQEGQVCRFLKNYPKAVEAFSECIQLRPNDADFAEAYFYRGETYLKRKDLGKALLDFKKVLQLKLPFSAKRKSQDETYLRAWLKMAEIYGKQGKWGSALRSLGDFFDFLKTAEVNYGISMKRWRVLGLYLRAFFYFSRGDFSKARGDCLELLRLDPRYRKAKLLLEDILKKLPKRS